MMGMEMFSAEVAADVGVNAAIICSRIVRGCQQNVDLPDQFFHDGLTWMYIAQRQICEEFPYLKEGAVARALDKLINADYIKTGMYNRMKYDRTKWYAATPKALALHPVLIPSRAAAEAPVIPAPTPAPPILEDPPPAVPPRPRAKPTPKKQVDLSLFDKWYSAYPKKVGKQDAVKAWEKLAPDEEFAGKIMDGLRRAIQFDSRFRDKQYTPNPASWLNGRRWEDEFPELARRPAVPCGANSKSFQKLTEIAAEKGAPPPPRR